MNQAGMQLIRRDQGLFESTELKIRLMCCERSCTNGMLVKPIGVMFSVFLLLVAVSPSRMTLRTVPFG